MPKMKAATVLKLSLDILFPPDNSGQTPLVAPDGLACRVSFSECQGGNA
jgi:hypothetical protein